MAENDSNKPGGGASAASSSEAKGKTLSVRWPLDRYVVGKLEVTRKPKKFNSSESSKILAAAKRSGVKIVEKEDDK